MGILQTNERPGACVISEVEDANCRRKHLLPLSKLPGITISYLNVVYVLNLNLSACCFVCACTASGLYSGIRLSGEALPYADAAIRDEAAAGRRDGRILAARK
jgi:hypothetical protein